MTAFETLNAAYAKWRDDYFADQRSAVQFCHHFAAEFRKYIKALESYEEPFEKESKVSRYVWASKATLNEEEHTFTATMACSTSARGFIDQLKGNVEPFGLASIRRARRPGCLVDERGLFELGDDGIDFVGDDRVRHESGRSSASPVPRCSG